MLHYPWQQVQVPGPHGTRPALLFIRQAAGQAETHGCSRPAAPKPGSNLNCLPAGTAVYRKSSLRLSGNACECLQQVRLPGDAA